MIVPLLSNPAPIVLPLVPLGVEFAGGPGWASPLVAVRAGEVTLIVGSGVRSWTGGTSARTVVVGSGRVELTPKAGWKSSLGFDGILGSDFLRDRILGFDPDGRTLTIWPSGTAPKVVEAWAGERAVSAPLEVLPDGRPVLRVVVDGTPRRLLAAPSMEFAGLWGAAVPEDPFILGSAGGRPRMSTYLASKVSAPGRTLDWLVYTPMDDTKKESAENIVGLDGFLPLFEGTRGRLVLDVPGRRVLSRPAGVDGRIEEELARTLRIGVRVEGDRMILAATGWMLDSSLNKRVGREIVFIGENSPRRLPELWREGSRAHELINWLFVVWREGGPIAVLPEGGAGEPEGILLPGAG